VLTAVALIGMFSPPSRVELLLLWAYLNRIQFLEEPEVGSAKFENAA